MSNRFGALDTAEPKPVIDNADATTSNTQPESTLATSVAAAEVQPEIVVTVENVVASTAAYDTTAAKNIAEDPAAIVTTENGYCCEGIICVGYCFTAVPGQAEIYG